MTPTKPPKWVMQAANAVMDGNTISCEHLCHYDAEALASCLGELSMKQAIIITAEFDKTGLVKAAQRFTVGISGSTHWEGSEDAHKYCALRIALDRATEAK